MVAGGPNIIADGIHGSDHGMQVIVQEQFCGVGLNGIACIHHQRVPGAALLEAVACWATLPEASALLAA